jgi:hypothetical protein
MIKKDSYKYQLQKENKKKAKADAEEKRLAEEHRRYVADKEQREERERQAEILKNKD